jgi:hypothetical protein
LDDVGSVGLEGDVAEGAFRVPVAAADIMGDVGDCGLVPVGGAVASGNGARPCGAGGRGSCIRASNLMPTGSDPRTPAGRGVDGVLVLRVRGVGGEEDVVVRESSVSISSSINRKDVSTRAHSRSIYTRRRQAYAPRFR